MVETDYYEYMLHRLEHEKRIERDARKIAKRLVVVVERKRLAKKRRAAVLVQSAVRRYLARNKYLRWLRAQMKPVTVKLLHIPVALMDHGVVVLTVYDMLKEAQSFRLDATVESAMKQGFLIPGLAANLTLLFTIARKEEFSDGR
jgi:predicted aspartyl protease